jgi:thymidylate kinase
MQLQHLHPTVAPAHPDAHHRSALELQETLLRVFEALDRADIPCCVLHGYDRFPDSLPDSDVDCLVAPGVAPRTLAAVLHAHRQQIGAELAQVIWHQQGHTFILARRSGQGSWSFLRLDICTAIRLRQYVLYLAETVLRTRRRGPGFWIPDPSIELGHYLARCILRGRMEHPHMGRLTALHAQAPDGSDKQVRRFWSPASAHLICSAIRSGNRQVLCDRSRPLARELLARSALRHPLYAAGNWLANQWRRASQACRPRSGLDISFHGPDGVGKSSVIQAVERDLAPAFFGTHSTTFAPRLLRRTGPRVDWERPHAVPPRPYWFSMAKGANWVVDYTLGHLLLVRPALARSQLFLFDRYAADLVVDPRRYLYRGPRWLLRVVWRLALKPQLQFLLQAPGDAVHARKQELPPEEIDRQVREFSALLGASGTGRRLDASMPLARVIADAEDAIVQFLVARTARRLNLELT